MDQTANQFRSLAISLSSRGFGYAVMEGDNALVAYGNKIINGDKNTRSLTHIAKLITNYQPNFLVLHDVNAKGTHRAPRIKQLHRKVVALAKKRNLRVVKIAAKELRNALLGDEDGTKQEIAELLAKQFPNELASRLPPKRKTWDSEDARMDIFDATALALVFRKR